MDEEIKRIKWIILGECNNVVASMRNNIRWASNKPRRLQDESPLLKGFKNLRNLFDKPLEVSNLDSLTYLKPFLAVIRSEETNGIITGVALSSVNKFVNYLLGKTSKNADKSLESIAEAVIQCRFEATDPESDEVVLMKILEVLLSCIESPLATSLPDELVFEMVQTCYKMGNLTRLSELLRKTAEQTVIKMIETIFHHVSFLTNQQIQNESSHRINHNGNTFINSKGVCFVNEQGNDKKLYSTKDLLLKIEKEEVGRKGFGLACLVKLMAFLCSILQFSPDDDSLQLDEPCFLGLKILNTIIDTCDLNLLQTPQLLVIFRDNLCSHNLLKCIYSTNLSILTLCLRIYFDLFMLMGHHLKPQIEIFFNCILKVIESKTFPIREIFLEILLDFSKEPQFITDLYVNFDCDPACSNVFEDLCKFLYKQSFSNDGSFHSLALEALLSILRGISQRITEHSNYSNNNNKNNTSDIIVSTCRSQKQFKSILQKASETFNKDPTESLKVLQETGLFDSQKPSDVAAFFKQAFGINKTILGEFLGKNKEFNIEVLDAYVKSFDFKKDLTFVHSLRRFLESFRIPGEAQVIARILELFAKHYCSTICEPFENVDAAYILAYSIVMLNVDQHKPGIKNRMNEADFIRNNREINNGKDLPQELLSTIYRNIHDREIKIIEEQTVLDNVIDYCKNRYLSIKPFVRAKLSSFDQDLFITLRSSLITSISFLFEKFNDEELIKDVVLSGFYLSAQISSHFDLFDSLDNLIATLCKFSNLFSIPSSMHLAVYEFGKSKKAQMAAELLFQIALNYGNQLREGWRNLLKCLINLKNMKLLNFFKEELEEDTKPVKETPSPSLSILNSFSGFFFSGGTSPQTEHNRFDETLSNEQITLSRKNAEECIEKCKIQDILSQTTLSDVSLFYLIKAISIESSVNIQSSNDKNSIFCINLFTDLILNNHQRIDFLKDQVKEYFIKILSSKVSVKVSERIIMNFIKLCITFQTEEMISHLSELLFNSFNKKKKETDLLAEKVSGELFKILQTNSSVLRLQNLLFIFLKYCSQNSTSEEVGLKMLSYLLQQSKIHLVSSNFMSWVKAVQYFTSPQCSPETTIKALDFLHLLYLKVSELNSLNFDHESNKNESFLFQSWNDFWLPILQDFATLCQDPRPTVRNFSMTYLQRCLLSAHLTVLPPSILLKCFQEVIFPLMTQLIQPNPNQGIDQHGLEETRLRASTLLSKIFLQYLSQITSLPDFMNLWLRVLQFQETYMKSNDNEYLGEGVRESLKNMLLVMSASGVLKPGVLIGGEDMWKVTWDRVNSFCPTLHQEFEILFKS